MTAIDRAGPFGPGRGIRQRGQAMDGRQMAAVTFPVGSGGTFRPRVRP